MTRRKLGEIVANLESVSTQLQQAAERPQVAPKRQATKARHEQNLDDAALFDLLVRGVAPIENRLAALHELTRRDAADLDRAILASLQKAGADERWKRALVICVERTSPKDPGVRLQLADALLAAAVALRDAVDSDADEPMWAAIRMFGSLAPIERIHELLVFLRSQDRGTTRQVALQAMWAMLEGELPRESSDVDNLRRRVSDLAAKYLDNDQLVTAEAVSLATFAFCVSVLVRSPAALDLTRQLLSLGRPRMIARSRTIIEEALGARRKRGVPADDLNPVLAELANGAER